MLAPLLFALLSAQPKLPPPTQVSPAAPSADNAELAQLLEQELSAKDSGKDAQSAHQARREKALALYQQNSLKTGADYYAVAAILQKGNTPEDDLLCHELAVAGISLGERRALWVAAVCEDRFLRSIGRPQRYATQYTRDAKAGPKAPWELAPVEDGVTDPVRKLMRCPSLEDARAKAKALK